MLSIVIPLKKASPDFMINYSTISAALIDDAAIYIGIQEWQNSDQNMLEWLEMQPYTKLLNNTGCANLSQNLNSILKVIPTKYAVRMDGDDFMHPKRLYWLKEFLGERNPAIVAQSYYPIIGKSRHKRIRPFSKSIDNKLMLLTVSPFAHPAITLNLEKIGRTPYNEKYDYAQDYILYVEMMGKGDYLGIDSTGIYYNVPNPGQHAYLEKRQKQLEVHEIAMFQAWSSIPGLSFPITHELIHSLRCNLATDEFAKCVCNEDEAYKARILLAEARSKMLEYLK